MNAESNLLFKVLRVNEDWVLSSKQYIYTTPLRLREHCRRGSGKNVRVRRQGTMKYYLQDMTHSLQIWAGNNWGICTISEPVDIQFWIRNGLTGPYPPILTYWILIQYRERTKSIFNCVSNNENMRLQRVFPSLLTHIQS